MNPTSFLSSVSTAQQVKQGSTFNIREILPANRSSLATGKLLQGLKMKCSSNLTRTGKESSIVDEGSTQDYNDKVIDLVSPILLKKRKLLITGPDQSNCGETSHHISNLVKDEHKQFPENVTDHNPREKEVLVYDSLREERTAELNITKHENAVSDTASQDSSVAKGAAFLRQVKYLRLFSHYTLYSLIILIGREVS